MARFLVCCLIWINAHLILSMSDADQEKQVVAESPTAARKLGNHHLHRTITAPSPSPSPSEVDESGSGAAQEQVLTKHHHNHHRSIDKSIAGGGVILGALATVFLVAVFCYIRATGRKTVEPFSPSSDAFIGRDKVEPGSSTHP